MSLVFGSSFGAPFAVMELLLSSFGIPFGRLFVTFCVFVGFCWMALTLERKRIFSCFGPPGPALVRPLFQVWIQGVFFNGFYGLFCDLGII